MALDDYPTALVTGASSGIGAATVEALCSREVTVHAVARRRERLDALADRTGCQVHVLDIRDHQRAAQLATDLEVDLLVNNAGLGRAMGGLVDATLDDIERTIDTNVTSTINLTRAALGAMIDRGNGHIVNVGSMSGLHRMPAALYGASKGAVHLLSTNLRLELEGTGVRVTEICPGRVSTEFYDVAIDDDGARDRTKQSGIEEVTAADVAAAIVYAVDAPWRVNVNLIELQPTEQTYGGSRFVARRTGGER